MASSSFLTPQILVQRPWALSEELWCAAPRRSSLVEIWALGKVQQSWVVQVYSGSHLCFHVQEHNTTGNAKQGEYKDGSRTYLSGGRET